MYFRQHCLMEVGKMIIRTLLPSCHLQICYKSSVFILKCRLFLYWSIFFVFISATRTSDSGTYTILDCIFNEQLQCYFILDLMCWCTVLDLYAVTTECRQYWIFSKLNEIAHSIQTNHNPKLNKYAFHPITYLPCTMENMK